MGRRRTEEGEEGEEEYGWMRRRRDQKKGWRSGGGQRGGGEVEVGERGAGGRVLVTLPARHEARMLGANTHLPHGA